jgi:putative tryptophan/tyrosine transport system substrate-binding protein
MCVGVAMRRRKFITMLGGAAMAWPLAARAQQASGIPKVGFLYPGPEAYAKMRCALMLEGLRTQGFREPEQVVVLVRATGGDPARSALLLAELVASKIDILLPMGGLTLTLAAESAAANIPIVTFDFELDPVESGLLKNLAHPGGNVTGIFLDLPDISTAWLELLKQAVPSLASIAVLWDPSMPAVAQHNAVLAAAKRLNITTEVMEVKTPAELDSLFEAAGARRPDVLLMLTAPLMSIYSKHIAELTFKYRLPAISMFSSFARAGGLMAYGPNLEDLYREVGVMTGKILKGTKPADLPAERPARFELVVNLKAAKALDLNISNLVLARADEVIE